MFDSACNRSSNMIMREKFNKRTEENELLVLQKFFFSGICNLIDFVNQ